MSLFERVEEGEEIVIYRFGGFNRIAGPGLVRLTPGLDEVHHRLDVRERQKRINVPTILVSGIPVSVGIQFRVRLDIRRATDDPDRQRQLVTWDEWQREEQLQDSVRHSVVGAIKRYEQAANLSPDADLLEKLAPVLPATPANENVSNEIRTQLEHHLANIGFILSVASPFWLSVENLPETLVEAFDRSRADQIHAERYQKVWQRLMTYIEDLPPHLKAHMLTVTANLPAPPITIPATSERNTVAKIKQDSESSARVEVETSFGGLDSPRYVDDQSNTDVPEDFQFRNRILTYEDVAQVKVHDRDEGTSGRRSA